MAVTDFMNIATVTMTGSEVEWTLPSSNIHSVTIIPRAANVGTTTLAVATGGSTLDIPSTGYTIDHRNGLKNATSLFFNGTNLEVISIHYFLGTGR